jgi:RNA polymerase sigma-70 factor (ECF subfamily)
VARSPALEALAEPPVGGAFAPEGAVTEPRDTSHGADAAWFERVFDDAYRPLVAYARRRTGDESEADDVVAEVFTVAWRRRRERLGDSPPNGSELPWLYGIAANVIRNQRRSRGRRLRLVERLEAQPRSPSIDPADVAATTLRAALDRLSFDDQELLRLVAWEGLTHAEIGSALGISTNAVGIRAHRARKRLEAELSEHDSSSSEEGTS